jgi:hypothetical protein
MVHADGASLNFRDGNNDGHSAPDATYEPTTSVVGTRRLLPRVGQDDTTRRAPPNLFKSENPLLLFRQRRLLSHPKCFSSSQALLFVIPSAARDPYRSSLRLLGRGGSLSHPKCFLSSQVLLFVIPSAARDPYRHASSQKCAFTSILVAIVKTHDETFGTTSPPVAQRRNVSAHHVSGGNPTPSPESVRTTPPSSLPKNLSSPKIPSFSRKFFITHKIKISPR